jgi:hypothetical protein
VTLIKQWGINLVAWRQCPRRDRSQLWQRSNKAVLFRHDVDFLGFFVGQRLFADISCAGKIGFPSSLAEK